MRDHPIPEHPGKILEELEGLRQEVEFVASMLDSAISNVKAKNGGSDFERLAAIVADPDHPIWRELFPGPPDDIAEEFARMTSRARVLLWVAMKSAWPSEDIIWDARLLADDAVRSEP
jgi:hypothetical protein